MIDSNVATATYYIYYIPFYYLSLGAENLYTTSTTEMNNVISGGWTYQGIACYVLLSNDANTVPLYRLYNNNLGDHLYTVGETEKNNLINGGWTYEGIACYVPNSQITGTVPFYRLFNGTVHYYTDSTTAEQNAINNGYHLEGIACYVWQ